MPSARAIPVEQLAKKTGDVIAVHESLYAAAEAVGKPNGAGNISNVANGKLKSAYGFGWRYKMNTDSFADEEWKPFEDVEVSSYGRVRRSTASGQSYISDRRDVVTINNKSWPVHRLIARVFSSGINEIDTQLLDPSYIAGFVDGDGSVNLSLTGPQGKQGYLLKVEISQCNEAFLHMINGQFGHAGKIYRDNRRDKYRGETNYALRFCGKAAKPILDILARHGIIKAKQACLALEFLDLPRMNAGIEKEKMRQEMSALNADKSYEKPMSRMSAPYIAGLFDAEGNVYSSQDINGKVRNYVKITQKSDPAVLQQIVDFLGYGYVSEKSRWRIYGQDDITAFHAATTPYLHIKKVKLDALVKSFSRT